MHGDMKERAKLLAERPYSIQYVLDETTDGQPICLLSHRELPGCMAQGATIEEAESSLDDARREYILSLLEDGVPVPDPIAQATVTASFGAGTNITGTVRTTQSSFQSDLSQAARPLSRRLLAEVVPVSRVHAGSFIEP